MNLSFYEMKLNESVFVVDKHSVKVTLNCRIFICINTIYFILHNGWTKQYNIICFYLFMKKNYCIISIKVQITIFL